MNSSFIAATHDSQPARRTSSVPRPFGEELRHWRQHRRFSQLDLAQVADISTRHLSFVETGRSVPSREMVLRLSERLDIPLRERNTLLVAAGYAPMYRERKLDDPALNSVRQAVELILKSHEPYPAIAIDRYWNLVDANSVVVTAPKEYFIAWSPLRGNYSSQGRKLAGLHLADVALFHI